ncbi:unnamed protein product [Aphanomyces euteiches]
MLGLDDVKRQIAALCLIMLLSIDAINPVKALCSVFEIDAAVVGYVHFVILIAVVYANFSDVAYFAMQVYLNSVLSIFLKSIEIVGKENVPMTDPVIFTGNHTNQFVDGMLVLMNCFRKVGFLIAEKSMHRPVVGDIARIMGCIPIVRPQDAVLPGVGTVAMKDDDQPDAEEYILVGTDTAFTKALASGDQVRVNGTSVATSGPPVKVVRVIDDTHLVLSAALVDHEGQAVKTPQAYGIFKKVDQSHAFNEVYASLKRGQCVGIFPEGGSHDRTDLLPLKAGVALMALGAKAQHDITVPVVPIGLTYFRGHHFRSRVVIEFGAPITVSDEVMALYAKDKRAACNDFLTTVEEGMRSVLVTTPDYNVLQNVYTARRLFQSRRLPRKITQDLNRRFAESYKILHDHPAARDEVETLMMDLRDYRVTLKTLGLADYQVPFVADVDVHSMISAASYFLGMFILSSLPSIILNAPVGFAARAVARQEQKRALAGSSVKIAARDVILSKKLTFSMVAVPTLWCTYLILAILFTSWSWTTIFLFAMSMPIFSYFGVRSVEAGIIELKTLQPVFNRLRPKYRKIQEELPARRIALQKRVRAFVSKWASVLGPLAAPEPMDWAAYMRARVNKQDAVSDNGETITTEHDLSFLHHKSVNVDAAAVALDKKTV